MSTPKVAFVHDWLTAYAGAEKVLEAMLELFPEAPIYTLVYQPENFKGTIIANHQVHTSFIEHLPKGKTKYRSYLPFMPLAIEQFDLSDYNLIISSSHAVAKGVLTRADQLHISYVHTPMRYAWDLHFQYLKESGLDHGLKGTLAKYFLHRLRLWDRLSADRVDCFIANSKYVARRINKTYRREAEVIYPPVDVERFNPGRERENFYLTMSRLVPYKKIDLIVEAFTKMNLPLVVIGDGPDREKIKKLAGPTIKMLGYQPDEVVKDYMERCKAFVFAAEEDFGIVPVEAQAAGAPVIAFGKGGALETIVEKETGLFFNEQTLNSLIGTVRDFEAGKYIFIPEQIHKNAQNFCKKRFQKAFSKLVECNNKNKITCSSILIK